MPTKIIYVYDALCGWCFGFSPAIEKLYKHYKDTITFEVISGGLITGSRIGSIGEVAPYISKAYLDVEKATGVKFGAKFLDITLKKGEAIFTSVPAAIAMCIMKETYPEKCIEFAALLHEMYYVDGIEPENIKEYGKYAATLGYDEVEFNSKMKDSTYIQKAYQDFEYAQELGVNGFPTLILEQNGTKETLFSGCVSFDRAKDMIDQRVKL